MIKVYTIGFTKKSAQEFFELLMDNDIEKVIDIRLNNSSQLAGFAKGRDLKYILENLIGIRYEHNIMMAPTKEILDNYKGDRISWTEYKDKYNQLLLSRNIINNEMFNLNRYDHVCFLCSEEAEDFCHRRLLVEFLFSDKKETQIIHLK